MRKELIISGYGGQGIMFFGNLLAYAGMIENKNVTFYPSYGAEIRGGTANCQVIISDDAIGAPIVSHLDILVALNQPSYKKFSSRVVKKGIIFANTSLFKPEKKEDVEIVSIDANKIAENCGSILTANMVMLGVLISRTGMLNKNSIIKGIDYMLSDKKKSMLDVNVKAFNAGYNCRDVACNISTKINN
jgi:2-oxoglutarate ferredoxin oxidoreductase subunit gamma